MSDDVVSQVRAAIQERRSSAEAAAAKHGAKWRYREATNGGVVEGTVENRTSGGMPESDLWDSEGGYLATTEGAAWHIAANDPASVLRLCDGMEQILNDHSPDENYEWLCKRCQGDEWVDDFYGILEQRTCMPFPCPTLLSLASMLGVGETE